MDDVIKTAADQPVPDAEEAQTSAPTGLATDVFSVSPRTFPTRILGQNFPWWKKDAGADVSLAPPAPPRAEDRVRRAVPTPVAPLAALEARNISAWFGDHQVLDRVSLTMPAENLGPLAIPLHIGGLGHYFAEDQSSRHDGRGRKGYSANDHQGAVDPRAEDGRASRAFGTVVQPVTRADPD